MTESLSIDLISAFDENYKIIREKIVKAAEKSGRSEKEITLLAATKTVSPQLIAHAIDAGIDTIGENRVQEFLSKYDTVYQNKCDCHFIGRLQTNKVRQIVGKVSCIESVDSLKLAKTISDCSVKHGIETQILIEVNIGAEKAKGGVLPEELLELIEQVSLLPNIRINGLMSIPPICESRKEIVQYFSSITQYFVDIKNKNIDNVDMNCLSMGMSSDYVEAIECGATLVRIGSSLFGSRKIT